MDLQLNGSRVLVTGGTRGIGRAIVEAFVDEGAVVEFCARDAAEIEETEKALAERVGGRATGVQLDVRDGPALTAWVRAAADRMGGLNAVVANVSAIAVPDTEENWYTSFEVDLMHTVRLARTALPHLEASKGAIVAISSVSGREADFASGPYGTMKTAIVAYIQGLALEVAPRGVRANTVSPGNTYFDNGFWQGAQQGNPELFSFALGLNPTGRMGKPEEMARAVVFLASPMSSFTTGTNLVVDGALTRGIQL
jgi:3-oxoacyl-[acyl-carrier protein] reductase